eukprot:9199029-Ditylum_brightwellii.AAC.1
MKEWKKYGEVILTCDMNLPFLAKEISKFLANHGLSDVLGTTHSTESPKIQITESQTTNYLFATSVLWKVITKFRML